MTAPAASSAGSGVARLRARVAGWVHGHTGQAAAGAGVIGVAGYALWRRHQAAASGNTSAADSGAPAMAGLSGTPATGGTDLGSLQNEIDQLNQALNNPSAPSAPKPPPYVADPGKVNYTVQPGDTLAKIAQKVYGSSAGWAIALLKKGNKAWATFGATDSLSHWAGRAIHVPAAHPGSKAYDPKNPNNTYHPPKKKKKKKAKK